MSPWRFPTMAVLAAWLPHAATSPRASRSEPYRELIEQAVRMGRNAMAIWQDLVDRHGFVGRYTSVRRLVAKLRENGTPEAHPVITTAPARNADCSRFAPARASGPSCTSAPSDVWAAPRASP